jgi:WG containing repeat
VNKRIAALVASAVLGWSAMTPSGQAAGLGTVQPYVTDYKFGFTDGSSLVTKAVFDDAAKWGDVYVVTKGGKKGIVDVRTGKEITPPVWDDAEIPGGKNIAVVRKGGWFQYIDLPKRALSPSKFAGAHTYFLSKTYPTVIAMGGSTSMLLDSSGNVLLPPFQGKIEMADVAVRGTDEDESVRYLVTTTAQKLTVYDPVTLTPLFSLPHASLVPNDGVKPAYIRVASGGKQGLADLNGRYVLKPTYKALIPLPNGFFRVEGAEGIGLWKDGRMLAAPRFADVGVLHDAAGAYYTVSGGVVTYHSTDGGTPFTLKGAEYLHGGYVLGQDPATGLYGVKNVRGETVVPFVYPRVEGVPAMRLLVRSDGKKGILRGGWGRPVQEPDAWFDAVTTLGGYDLLSVQDGTKVGLYSQQAGLLVPPAEHTQIRYDSGRGTVTVTGPDGKPRIYRSDGSSQDPNEPTIHPLTDKLSKSESREGGVIIIDTETRQPIGKPYNSVYTESNGRLVVAVDSDAADLYTPDGSMLTTDVRIATQYRNDAPPVSLIAAGEAIYAAGTKNGEGGLALVKIANGALQVESDFRYRGFAARQVKERMLFVFERMDGSRDLWLGGGDGAARRLEGISGYRVDDASGLVFVQQNGGWDAYSADGNRLTNGGYRSLEAITTASGQRFIAYQDQRTGLYGLLGADFRVLTPPKYESVRPADQVFIQFRLSPDLAMPFVFTTGNQFGYLNGSGQEVFRTALLTKKPAVSYRPLTLQTFDAYRELLQNNPLELVDFGRPYRWPEGASSEQTFFANLALYFNLPAESGKREVMETLTAKGIIKEDPRRAALSDDDFFALMYYVVNGKTSQSLTKQQLWDWAGKRGLVRERGGMSDYQSMDLYAEYHQSFFRELLRTQAAAVKPKTLSLGALSEAQRRMLRSLVVVNGRALDQLPLPLPQAELNRHLEQLVRQYNKQAPQMLKAALAER